MINNDSSAYKITEDEEYVIATPRYGSHTAEAQPAAAADFEGSAAPAIEVPGYAEPSADEIYVYEQEKRRGNAVMHEIRLKNQRRKAKNGILFKVSLLLILGLIVGVRFASVTEINYRNQSLQRNLDSVNSEVKRRTVELNQAMSLTELAEIAENELGMQKPQQYQIRYLNVEKIDQTELADVELTRTTEETAWYRQIWNAILQFLGIIE